MMNDTIRAFIAIPLDPTIQQAIKHIQDHFKGTKYDIKWVKPENIHITLKFLGSVSVGQISSVKQALAYFNKNTRPFTVKLSQLGAFPNIDHPHILWVGLNNNDQCLARMIVSLEKALATIEFQVDQKPFSPHITIGRIRSSKNINLLSRSILNYQISESSTQTISRITLLKSTLRTEGPTYEFLYQKKLGG